MKEKLMKQAAGLIMVLFILTPVLAFSFSLPALAAANIDPYFNGGNNGTANGFANDSGLPGSGTNLYATITKIISFVMGFLGIIAVIVILIAGFKWMTAGGNEDKVGEAKKLLVAGLIGLIIVILAYAIATFVITQLLTVTNP
jgi:hypothetical protein